MYRDNEGKWIIGTWRAGKKEKTHKDNHYEKELSNKKVS